MNKVSIIVQASSTSWSGGKDLCINLLDGKPVVQHTLERLLTALSGHVDDCWLIAPEFDRGGLDFIRDCFAPGRVKTFYGHNDSPLLRMLAATSDHADDHYFLRVNGLNFCVDTLAAINNLALARTRDLDCVRFPDNFPALFTSDVYRVGALRKMLEGGDSSVERKFHIHPKYFLARDSRFQCAVAAPDLERYGDDVLNAVRERCKLALHTKRVEVDTRKSIRVGDAIALHYELAKRYMAHTDKVLDLACGSGFGTKILAEQAGLAIGVDNDTEIVKQATAHHLTERTRFIHADAFNLPFESGYFDCVAAFEIIEHLDPPALLAEIKRVLKPGGIVMLSTPQNILGHIPITPDHEFEFSVDQLTEIVGQCFRIDETIGIKQGTIFFEGDPIGANTFMVASKDSP